MPLRYTWDEQYWLCELVPEESSRCRYGVGDTWAEARAELLLALCEEREIIAEGGDYWGRDADIAEIDAALAKYEDVP